MAEENDEVTAYLNEKFPKVEKEDSLNIKEDVSSLAGNLSWSDFELGPARSNDDLDE